MSRRKGQAVDDQPLMGRGPQPADDYDASGRPDGHARMELVKAWVTSGDLTWGEAASLVTLDETTAWMRPPRRWVRRR